MMQIIKSYLKFLLNSTSIVDTRPVFINELVNKCFYDEKKYPEYTVFEEYRNALLADKNKIEVSDFGAGSRFFKSNVRAVNQIVQKAGISPDAAKLLFRVTHFFQLQNVLEIGTSLGLATCAMSLGNKNSKIITLEGCSQTIAIAEKVCQVKNLNNIEFLNVKFEDYLNKLDSFTCNPQLIYFDGNHSKKATLDYYHLLLPTVSDDSIWIFDDIHWSVGMEEAWETIKNHPRVSITIDTFQWGIVFFKSVQKKEHFIINPNKNIAKFILNKLKGSV